MQSAAGPVPSPPRDSSEVSRQQIASAVTEALRHEALANELRLARARLIGWTLGFAVTLLLLVFASRPPSSLLITFSAMALSALLFVAFRRSRYRWWFPVVASLVDAALIHWACGRRIADVGLSGDAITTTSVLVALLAVSGSVRFTRVGSVVTTLLAGAVYLHLLWDLGWPSLIFGFCGLIATGLLAMYLTEVVRGSMERSAGQTFLRRFLPPGLVDGAFTDPLALISEARVAEGTVLLSDLRGFTAIAEALPPPEVLALLNQVQGELARIVQANGGTVDKFMGDGMLAVFGVPVAMDDHAQRAVLAARQICEAMERINRARGDAALLRIGIGLHSGSMIYGCLGSGERLEFTIIGDTVNVASRLEGMTKELGRPVLLSGETARRLGEANELVPLGEVALRGRAQPLPVFGLQRTGSAATAA
jgi:adenylate cyclase